METVVQHEDSKYDIDYGIIFAKESLVGERGADKAPRAARQMVADAFKDKRFDSNPIVKTNCVRFPYAAGYHVDMPVYRQSTNILARNGRSRAGTTGLNRSQKRSRNGSMKP